MEKNEIMSIPKAAAYLHKKCNINLQSKFNPQAYPTYKCKKYERIESAEAMFVSGKLPPYDPYFLGFFGSAWEKENCNGNEKELSNDLCIKLEDMTDIIVKLNDRYGNIVIIDGACPKDSVPSTIARMVKIKSRKKAHKEVYSIGVHPATRYDLIDEEDLMENKDLIIFTNYLNVWHGNYCDAFRDRDSRNCDWVHAGVLLHGGIGTLDEAVGLAQKDKIIVPYLGTKGAADGFKNFKDELYNGHKALVIGDNHPKRLIKRVVGQMHLDRILYREQDPKFSIVDIHRNKSNPHGHIWDMIMDKEQLKTMGLKNGPRDPNYRVFPFKRMKVDDTIIDTIERTILPLSLDEVLKRIDLKPDSFDRHKEYAGKFINKCVTINDYKKLDKKIKKIRSEGNFIWHAEVFTRKTKDNIEKGKKAKVQTKKKD